MVAPPARQPPARLISARPSRRAALRLAAAIAAAVLPGRAVAQWPKISEISQASLDARRDIGRLVWQADNLLRQTAADGAERAPVAVRRFRAERAAISRNIAALLNSRVSEDDWPLLLPTSEIELQLAMQPLVIRLAPTNEAVEAAIAAPLPKLATASGDKIGGVLLGLAFGCLGLDRKRQNSDALFPRLEDNGAVRSALDNVAAALATRRYGVAAFEIERLMRLITGSGNAGLIAELAGNDALRTVYSGAVLYFVPFAGWGYFTAYMLASIYENRDAIGPMLR